MSHREPVKWTNLLTRRTLPGGAILPLRLFLGLSFLSAGFDKLTDPAYLDPNARNYIGQQIANMAPGTPLEGFLITVAAPNATLFGVLTMGGEFCIGLAILLGLVTRFSAVMGLFLNLTFFLSATWDVRPFYFGADLPYVVGWLTLALAGPGPFALDEQVARWWAARTVAGRGRTPVIEADGTVLTRRAFLSLSAAGLAGAILAGSGLGWGLLHARRSVASAPVSTPTPLPPVAALPPTAAPVPPTNTVPPAAVPAELQPTEAPPATAPPAEVPPTDIPPTEVPTPAPAAGEGRTLLAAPGALPSGHAVEFILPSGDPAVLVHTKNGYSAYVAICTHQGCQVAPTGSGVLACPCHGARFDPAANGRVLTGPARLPLSPVAILVDPDGSVYLDET